MGCLRGTSHRARAGSPADPNTGALERVNADGTMSAFAERPEPTESFQADRPHGFRRHPHGEIWTVDNVW